MKEYVSLINTIRRRSAPTILHQYVYDMFLTSFEGLREEAFNKYNEQRIGMEM